MNKAQQNELQTKIMEIPGMDLGFDSGFQLDEVPERDIGRTHFRFTSDGGAVDNFNGDVFTKYMRSMGVNVEQRRPKLVIVENTELIRIFNLHS